MSHHNNSNNNDDYDIRPIDFRRALVIDAGYLSHNRHIIHGLLEVDVTLARQVIHQYNSDCHNHHPNPKLSFTAFLVASFAQAIAQDPTVQALPDHRGCWCHRKHATQVVFRNVDVVTMIEPAVGQVAIPHIIRDANVKSVVEITQEIRTVQMTPTSSAQQGGAIDVAAKLPRWIRMLAYRWFRYNPHRFRHMQGTAMLTSVGMFGQRSGGYAIGFLTIHTLGMTVGGISRRPGYNNLNTTLTNVDGSPQENDVVEPREYLNLTLSFDHDVVDGAPAARFAQRLVEVLQRAAALEFLQQATTSINGEENNNRVAHHRHSE